MMTFAVWVANVVQAQGLQRAVGTALRFWKELVCHVALSV